jgi:atypical dual specificity phosphatase
MGTGGVFLRRLRAKVLDEPTAFSWVKGGSLAASGFPASRNQVKWLAGKGITSILSLSEAPLPQDWVEGTGITVKHMPIQDHTPPELEVLHASADFVGGELATGKVVLVHCLAGKGRTGCALAAYFMKKEGMSADQAIRFVREKRAGSIERGQENALRQFQATQAGHS